MSRNFNYGFFLLFLHKYYGMDYGIKKEIEPILYSANKNRSFKLVWDILYYTRLLKYVHRTQYKDIRTRLTLAATRKGLSHLCKLGYMKEVQGNIFCTTNRAIGLLREVGYITDKGYGLELLPQEPAGKGDINEMNNTRIFLQALKLPNFYALLYPNFEYLKPDALLVRKEEGRYKLTFLEIEQKKPNWHEYIEHKKDNYLRLAKDINFYNYWKDTVVLLNLRIPEISSLKFSVCFVGDIRKDFGESFTFTSNLEA